MHFRDYLTLESVKGVKSHLATHQIVDFGKMGIWTVYSAIKSPQPPGKILSYKEYQNLFYSRKVLTDDAIYSKLKFESAAYKLMSLGFKKMHASVMLIDLSDVVNPITGGGIGGQASRSGHVIEIDRNSVAESAIIHEHAHMLWFQLPKTKKDVFANYYRNFIIGAGKDKAGLWGMSNNKFDTKGLLSAINSSWDYFERDFNFDRYFKLNDAINNKQTGRIIASTILSKYGDSVKARLKVPVSMENISGSRREYKNPGDVIKVLKFTDYILNAGDPNFAIEHQKVFSYDKLFDCVEFDVDLLTPEQLESYTKQVENIKKNPYKFFAAKENEQKINDAFKEAANNISRWFTFKAGDPYSSRFSAKQIFYKHDLFSSWYSVMIRRLKAGKIKTLDDVKKAYIDVIKKGIRNGFHNDTPEEISPSISNVLGGRLDSPDKSGLRDFLHKKGLSVSSYGAANVDEFWATTVEFAAMNQGVSKQLKDLIYQTIS